MHNMAFDPEARLAHLMRAAELAGIAATEFVLPAERNRELNGLRLHHLDWGHPDGSPIVFLHGGALTAHTWDLVCLALRSRWRCLALDQRGHGESEWSPSLDYRLEAHVRDLEAFIEAEGLERPVLVGQSL